MNAKPKQLRFRWRNAEPRSIGARIASRVVVIVILAAIAPNLITILFATSEINAHRAERATQRVEVLAGKFEEVIRYATDLPASIKRSYQIDDLIVSHMMPEGDSAVALEERLSKLKGVFENQILQLPLIRDTSILSAALGGREVLHIRWTDGRATFVSSETLNSAPNIPFFLKTLALDGEPTLRIVTPNDLGTQKARKLLLNIAIALKSDQNVTIGALLVTCDITDWLGETFSVDTANESLFLADSRGRVLFHADSNGMDIFPDERLSDIWAEFQPELFGNIHRVSTFNSGNAQVGIRPLSMADGNQYFVGVKSQSVSSTYANAKFISMILCFTLIIAVISMVWVRYLTMPIRRITELADDIANGKRDVASLERENQYSETEILTNALVTMRRSIEAGASAVRETALRLRIATTAANLGIWESALARPGQTYWSDEMYKLLGYKPQETGIATDIAEHICPESREEFTKLIQQAVLTSQTFKIETSMVCRDGTTRWFAIAGRPEADHSGSPARLVGTAQDIHELKLAETIKSEFVSIVSHELRTPMTSIIGSLTLINSNKFGDLPHQATRLLGIAEKNALRLLRLINEILDIEKMLKSKTQINREHFNIRTLLETSRDQMTPFCDEWKVRLELSEDVPSLGISADFDRLIQVLTNLISNAAKFSPHGERITVGATLENERIRFSVKDRGPGIPEEFRDRIFDPFSQADSSDKRKSGGTGLGLTIARSIVHLHDGNIWFDTSPAGTTFFFDLPASADITVAVPETQLSASSKKILFVENDPDLTEVLREYLPAHIHLQSAGTVAEAHELVAEQSFDLYVLDLSFPGDRGERLLETLVAKKVPLGQIMIYAAILNDAYPYPTGLSKFTKAAVGLETLVTHIEKALPREVSQ